MKKKNWLKINLSISQGKKFFENCEFKIIHKSQKVRERKIIEINVNDFLPRGNLLKNYGYVNFILFDFFC